MASNKNENVIEKVSGLLETSGSADKSITISDPVQVKIQVVTAGRDEKDKDQTSGDSTSAKTVKKLGGIVEQLSGSDQNTITINDPVQVTITVVQATKHASLSSSAAVETTEVTKPVTNTDTKKEESAKTDDKADKTTPPSSKDDHSALSTSSSATAAETVSDPVSTLGALTKAIATPIADGHSTEASTTTTTLGALTKAIATPAADDHSTEATSNTTKPVTEATSSATTPSTEVTSSAATPSTEVTSSAATPSTEVTSSAATPSTEVTSSATTSSTEATSSAATPSTEVTSSAATPSTEVTSSAATPSTEATSDAATPSTEATTTTTTLGALTKAIATPVADDHSTEATSSPATTTTVGAITKTVATPVADDHSTEATSSAASTTTVGAITKTVATPVADDHSTEATSSAATPSKETPTTTTTVDAITKTATTPVTSENGATSNTSSVADKPSVGNTVTASTEVSTSTTSTTPTTPTTVTTTTTTSPSNTPANDKTPSSETKASSATTGDTTSISGANTAVAPTVTATTESSTSTTTTSTTPSSTTTKNATEPVTSNSAPETRVFTIPKGNAKNLTDYQRKKAEYFFKSNLDKENKNSSTWKNVEDYLLSHVNSAGKAGANEGAVEADLSRGARDVWEHIFDQLPSTDGKRDSLTSDQFLDTWAGLVDYIVKNGQLPPSVQNLVDQGLDLHGARNGNDNSLSVPQATFDKIFSNMKLDPASASTAYKALTDNGTKPLDRDRLTSLVRAVIASSDDSHPSKYLLPGFVKDTMAKESSDKTDPSQTPSKPVTPNPSPTNTENNNKGSESKNADEKPAPSRNPAVPTPVPQPVDPRKLDDDVRRLLKFYGMTDIDFVEVDEGPLKHVVQINPNVRTTGSVQPRKESIPTSKSSSNGTTNLGQTTTTPKTPTLEERVAHGDVKVGPTIPVRVDEKDHAASSSGVREVFPDGKEEAKPKDSTAETPKVEKTQGESATKTDAQPQETDSQTNIATSSATETTTTTSNAQPATETPKGLTQEEEERIVGNIIKQVTPLVEELVAKELRKLRGGSEVDDDAFDFIPFPFMFAHGGPVFSAQGTGPSNQGQFRGQQSTSQGGRRSDNISGGVSNLPPELLMSMMADFGGVPPANVDPRFVGGNVRSSAGPSGAPRFPSGVEGFMMFVDDNSNIPSGSRRGAPRF